MRQAKSLILNSYVISNFLFPAEIPNKPCAKKQTVISNEVRNLFFKKRLLYRGKWRPSGVCPRLCRVGRGFYSLIEVSV